MQTFISLYFQKIALCKIYWANIGVVFKNLLWIVFIIKTLHDGKNLISYELSERK